MKHNVILIVASLLSILFTTFHLTDDIVRGMEPGTLSDLIAVPILVVWLYGTLVLGERRSGYVIILLGSLLGLVVPIIHMKGAGVGGTMAKSSGAYSASRIYRVDLEMQSLDFSPYAAFVRKVLHESNRDFVFDSLAIGLSNSSKIEDPGFARNALFLLQPTPL